MTKEIAAWGAAGGVLIAVLRFIEYKHFVEAYPSSLYGVLVAAIFTAVGIYLGLKWTRPKQEVAAAAPSAAAGFVLNEANLREVGLTQREREILTLIAEGLSNREIGERLFVSENTVKTHSSRVFQKLQVSRRVQAVQRAKDLGLIP